MGGLELGVGFEIGEVGTEVNTKVAKTLTVQLLDAGASNLSSSLSTYEQIALHKVIHIFIQLFII